jgi:hypothetical protein
LDVGELRNFVVSDDLPVFDRLHVGAGPGLLDEATEIH